ncbi:MAG: hypothetical protein K2R98_24015 [Gemmataceae bacterium]|nr:hypothetical protein [Gemmataceae bacterium]
MVVFYGLSIIAGVALLIAGAGMVFGAWRKRGNEAAPQNENDDPQGRTILPRRNETGQDWRYRP